MLTQPARRNRVSASMAIALMELAEGVEDDDAVRALAITGAGSWFSAGFDPDVDARVVEALARFPNRRSRSSMATPSMKDWNWHLRSTCGSR